jgi:aspartyl-tRNA(Asn)/glutamyl-tRNA(Gln) amidotransferase subunit A
MHHSTLAEIARTRRQDLFIRRADPQRPLARTANSTRNNSFITVTEDLRLTKPGSMTAARGENGGTSVSIGHKDPFCTQDVLTSCARKFSRLQGPYNHRGRQLAAGAVTLGKLNMDDLPWSLTRPSHYGAV